MLKIQCTVQKCDQNFKIVPPLFNSSNHQLVSPNCQLKQTFFLTNTSATIFPVFTYTTTSSPVSFYSSVIMAMKRFTRKMLDENRRLKQEIEKLREAVVTLLQDLTCARIQLSETQARLDAMVYCLGQEAAEHRMTKDLLNQCIQDRAQDRVQE